MTFEELIAELQKYKDSDEYNEFIKTFINKDSVIDYLTNDSDGKELFESKTDARVRQAIETWKTNNLDNVVQAKIKELYPDQTPEQKRIAELEAKFKAAEQKAQRSELITHALKFAQKKNLPTDLIKYFIGENQESTDKNITELETAFNDAIEKAVTSRMGESHKPDSGDQDHRKLTTEDFDKMSIDEIREYTNQQLKPNKN